MKTRLTIALPTYNRAQLLERQVKWLSAALMDVTGPLEIILSDNCSTDDTSSVLDRWKSAFSGHGVKVQRHERNLGAVGNIVSCMRKANGSHVWVVSDDDIIADETPGFVVHTLSETPDLALLALNFSIRDLYDRCFEVNDGSVRPNGQAVFEHCLSALKGSRWGGLALTSANVYRTDLVRAALESWPDGPANEMFQLYVGAYCARRGPAVVTQKCYLECASGDHYFERDPLTFLKLRSADISETFARMARDGYSAPLLLRKVVERPAAFLPMLPSCLRRSPRTVFLMQWRYALALASVTETAAKRAVLQTVSALRGLSGVCRAISSRLFPRLRFQQAEPRAEESERKPMR